MQPHETPTAFPMTTGLVPPGSSGAPGSSVPRLLVAAALGLPVPFFFSPLGVGPWWGQPLLVIAVLVVAAILGEVLGRVGQGGRSSLGTCSVGR
jgi:hypothetical protein